MISIASFFLTVDTKYQKEGFQSGNYVLAFIGCSADSGRYLYSGGYFRRRVRY